MPEEIIRETISVTRTAITPDDKELAQRYGQLVRESIEQARRMLRFGSPDVRLRIVLSTLSSAGRMAALDSKTETEVQRIAFERLIDEMTDIPERKQLVTTSEIIDVEATTVVESAHDQDNFQRLPQA